MNCKYSSLVLFDARYGSAVVLSDIISYFLLEGTGHGIVYRCIKFMIKRLKTDTRSIPCIVLTFYVLC